MERCKKKKKREIKKDACFLPSNEIFFYYVSSRRVFYGLFSSQVRKTNPLVYLVLYIFFLL